MNELTEHRRRWRDHCFKLVNGGFMSRLPIIAALLLTSAVTLYAQAQQPDMVKLKADAQKVVSIISHDKTKSQAYCQVYSLGSEMDQAEQMRDEQKGDVLTKKINELEQQIGPEYLALFDALNNADQNSKDFQDVLSMFDTLDESCRH